MVLEEALVQEWKLSLAEGAIAWEEKLQLAITCSILQLYVEK